MILPPCLLITSKVETCWWCCEVLSRRSSFHRTVLLKCHYLALWRCLFLLKNAVLTGNLCHVWYLPRRLKLSLRKLWMFFHHISSSAKASLAEATFSVVEGRTRSCVYVCVYLRPFTVKVSSVWISWNAREQINDVLLKMLLSSPKPLHRYFRMKHQAFLSTLFILFTHYKPRLS